MTFTVAPDTIYFAICLLLLILQVVQYAMITKVRRNYDDVWAQMGIMIAAFGAKLKEIETKIEENEKAK